MFVVTIRKVLAAVALVGTFMAGSAQAEMKIAVVNFQRLADESPQAKSASQVLQNEFAPRQRELQQQEKNLQTKAEKLNRDGAVMSEKEVTALKKELTKGQSDLQSEGESFTEEVNTRRNEELTKLQALLVTEVTTFAKNGGYDLVIPTSVALFAKDTYDVTAQMLTYLQSRPLAAPVAAAPAASKPATGSKAPTK
jgi:outer membrane protein